MTQANVLPGATTDRGAADAALTSASLRSALAGARVVVVGGSSGMGRAIAAAAHARGAAVTLVGRTPARLRFWGPYLVARYGAPALAATGSLTFFTGIYGDKTVPGAAVPSAVHGALERLARVLAVELAPRRVNVLSPGTTDTPLHAGMGDADRTAFFAQAAARTPAGRIGTADDVARAALFLLESAHTTGAVLRVDRGEALG